MEVEEEGIKFLYSLDPKYKAEILFCTWPKIQGSKINYILLCTICTSKGVIILKLLSFYSDLFEC